MKILLHLFLTLCLPALLAAQVIPQGMTFTVGTTARDGGGQDHAFLLWEAPKADLFGGKTFAIYGKTGAAASLDPFSQEGIVSGSLQPAVISNCLVQAAALGQDLEAFDEVIAGLHFGGFYPDPPPPLAGDRVAKTITVLTQLHAQPDRAGNVRKLIMVNPTLALCLGLAWSAPMSPAGITKTYELREWNAATSTDGPVIGRVTLTGGAPVILPAASRPVQVPDLTAAGDLKIGLRWGVPDALKRRIMLHQGFRLWRLPWALVQSQHYDAMPPDLAQLSAHISAGQAVAVTGKPLYIPKNLSPAQAELVTGPQADLTTYVDDDLGRLRDAANYVMPADGAEFGYIVTPRDILGRPGLPSPAGLGRIVKTVLPSTPREPAVELVFGTAREDGTRPQHFAFSFLANEDGAASPTTYYEVYRGTGVTVDGAGLPIPANLLMQIAHPAQPGRITHADMPPYNFNVDQQVWFCVRAVRTTPAGTFFSPLSPPVHASLVNNTPPADPVAVTFGNLCPQPGIQLNGTPGPVALDPAPDDGLHHFRMVCERLDAQVLKASFSIRRQGEQTEDLIEEIEFGGDDRVEAVFTLPDGAVGSATTFICRVHDGEAGLDAADYFFVRPAAVLPSNQEYVVRFQAAVLTPTSIDPDHPVSGYFLNTALAKLVETITLSPGARPAITAQVSNLGAQDAGGFQAQRLINGQWQACGFAQRTAPGADDVVFRDDSGEPAPATDPADYRLVPVQNLRGCSAGPTFFSVGSQGKANCNRLCMNYPIDPANEIVEYRFYRRVDDGPMTLFAEGRVKSGVTPNPEVTPNPICERDCNLPVTGGTVYYYGQVIAANGVGSVTVFLGGGTGLQEKLPRPVLAEPLGTGTQELPKVSLTWTCPAQGVDRFEVTLRPKGGDPITASVPAATLGSIPRTSRRKPPTNSAAIAAATLFVPAADIEVLKTDRVGSASMGSGPVFQWSSSILADTDYDISVRALAADGKSGGPDSAVYSFRWELPSAPGDPDVPWPFRALPQPASTEGEVANMTFDDDVGQPPHIANPMIWPAVTGGQVGFRIGSIGLTGDRFISAFTDWDPPGVIFSPDEFSRFGSKDFNSYIDKRNAETQDFVLPAVLYRQQLPSQPPNTEWPEVSGDVVQVSPLISRLLTTADPSEEFPNASFLRDPFIGVRIIDRDAFGNPIDGPATAKLYLLDTTPRAVGARYRYWLVCFSTSTGAPEYVIPATLEEVTP